MLRANEKGKKTCLLSSVFHRSNYPVYTVCIHAFIRAQIS